MNTNDTNTLNEMDIDGEQYSRISEMLDNARQEGVDQALERRRNDRSIGVTVQRKGKDTPDEQPRKIRLTGHVPGSAQGANESNKDYWLRMEHLTMHADQFVKLFAGAAIPILELICSVSEVQTVALPPIDPKWDDYKCTVGLIEGQEEPVAIRLSRSHSLEAGQKCLAVANVLREALIDLVDEDKVPAVNSNTKFNFGDPVTEYVPQADDPGF